ncbi:MAG TPA: 1-acyl-sn-glycerol-3-phosphate acyltransferase [Anaerolineales bacterium]|nr:1-acyl-sn-glycerol-3-phosphate acyltransferase [Anaerolineales bacterium]
MTLSQFDTITQINLNDLVAAFGWENQPALAGILKKLFIRPARNFAQHMVDFDNAVGRDGLNNGARQTLRDHYVQDVRVHGSKNIPSHGPVLFLSNHPGFVDTLCLFATINRPDLHIIAYQRPFLAALKNTTQKLFFISEVESERIRAVRQVSSHLKSGGAALTFPSGDIEPDPALFDDAADNLDKWTDSAGVFIRFARDTKIVPVLVSGVVWDKSLRHPLIWIKRTRKERERLAAALQTLPMLTRNFRPTTAHLQFAKPITLDEVGSTEAQAIHDVIIARMRGLIQNKPIDNGVSAL